MSKMMSFAAAFLLLAAPALAQTKATIQKLDDEWSAAFNRGDAAGVAAMYTPDAYVLPPGSNMVKGRSAIEALWRGQMQQIGDVKCTALDVRALGPRAAREIGSCTFKTKAQPPQEGAIKYAVVWERSRRSWKLLQDIWNTSK